MSSADRLKKRGEVNLMKSIQQQLTALSSLQPDFDPILRDFKRARAKWVNNKQGAEVIKTQERKL